KANMIGEYLKIKSAVRAKNREKMLAAQRMRSEGLVVKQIGRLLMLTRGKTAQWAGGRVRSPLVKANQLPAFEEWLKIARTDLEEPLLWESISAIEEVPIPDVRDLTVENGNHSFFANGFLVHNCDDHFHIEYLKDMLREDKVYGILAIDANDVGIGILSGESFEIVNVMTSGISGKTRK
ncbi:MAG: hypothetical protein OK454_07640, partial [Thaumarchaeota archaeon]|nr:hypothetical protein [Nitrososphaerota archaeon]